MEIEKFRKVRAELVKDAFKVSDKKGEDYRVGDTDALKNFKTVSDRTGLRPSQVLAIYMMKHQDAISNYIKSGGQSESEPIKQRIIDNINYLCLLWGIILEENEELCRAEYKGKAINKETYDRLCECKEHCK